MKILTDLRCLETPSGRRGVGRYTVELLRALKPLAPPQWRFIGLSWSNVASELGLEWLPYNGPRRGISFLDRYLLPRRFRNHAIDLYHSPVYGVVASTETVTVLTVHDLVADIHPEAMSWRHRLAFRRMFRGARHADRVIAVSETTRRELLKRYALRPEQVAVVPNGIARSWGASKPGELQMSGFRKPFLLYVGGLDQSKNVPFLLRVLKRARITHPELRLVVVGGAEQGRAALVSRARALGVAEHLTVPGYVEDERLAAAYREAAVFVFPSRYEGFGLPPLEAMAAGCPVVSTPCGALEENLKGAACLAGPDDVDAWTQAITELCRHAELRARQVAAGRERAATFTWERTARETLSIYDAALAAARRP